MTIGTLGHWIIELLKRRGLDRADARPDGREHPVGCVLARKCRPGIHTEAIAREGVAGRIGLAHRDVVAGDDDVEPAEPTQGRERLVGPANARRRDEREGDAGHSGPLDG
ncbi:MAG TPA: hypothetical protein PKN64_17610, partial [Casimicrobium sp.]|nr:hypothetical protein [Casimicrobium sp.]